MERKKPCWIIYCHTHVDSGRRYVGLTSRSMELRWRRHLADADRTQGRGCAYFWNAIRKYGKDAFSHEILERCDTLEAANLAEQKWIEQFDTRNPEKGFNLVKGGGHKPHRSDDAYRSDPEYLESQRKAAEERWKDPEYRTRTLDATQTALSSPEVRKNLSDGVKRAWENPEIREKFKSAAQARGSDPIIREKLRDHWDDPSFRERCSVGPRARIAAESAKTHCKHGHEYTPENTFLSPSGHRECKACNYARKKAAKTVCPKGHLYDGSTVVLSSSGRRICPICLAASKVKLPCRVCGSPKDMLVSGRLRCRPCGNRRALESRMRSSSSLSV